MRFWGYGRSALVVALAAANLSACTGMQSVTSLPLGAAQAHKAWAKSWVNPAASSYDLVYASDGGSNVQMFTYPSGQLVGSLTGFNSATGLCSDASGNVWVVDSNYYNGDSSLVEYAHAGSSPIAVLDDTNSTADVCAIDPSTGNLAAGNLSFSVAIWTSAQGSPTFYSTTGFMADVRTITYDGSGNLYIRSFFGHHSEAWLPKGGSNVMAFSIKKNGPYGWDGQYFVVNGGTRRRNDVLTLYKLKVGGGNEARKIAYSDCSTGTSGPFWISGSELAVACQKSISYYDYPKGGNAIGTASGVDYPPGIAISVSPSRPHKRK